MTRRRLKSGRYGKSACLVMASAVVTVFAGLGLARSAVAQSTPASNPNMFSLSAEGDGINIELQDHSLPVVSSISASPWGASASVSSLGGSIALAGMPYSPVLYSLPGTVNGLGSGATPPLPPVPGMVSSSYPTSPESSQVNGPYDISAQSGPDDSKAIVAQGLTTTGSNHATVFAKADTAANPDGSVSVTASAGVDVLNFGGLFDIGNISSTETMTEDGSHAPVTTGTTHLGTITLLGLTSGLIDRHLSLLGLNVTEPLSTALLPILNSLLKPAGMSFSYLPQTFYYADGSSSTGATPDGSKTLESIDSGALQLTINQTIPTQGPTTTILTFGRVYVSATDMAQPGLGTGPIASGPSSTANTSPVPPGGPGPVASAGLPGTTPASGPSTGAATAAEPSASPSIANTPSAAGGVPTTTPQTGSPSPGIASILTGSAAQGLYLLLVLAALAVAAGAYLARALAVRPHL